MIFGFKSNKPAREKTPEDHVDSRLRLGLQRTRSALTGNLRDLFSGKKSIDPDFLENLETRLLTADVGVNATTMIIDALSMDLKRQGADQPQVLLQTLHEIMLEILQPVDQPLHIPLNTRRPFVILMVGVNGAGKTTSAGKLAKYFLDQGRSVMLAAGDTFRAAA
ncbi:MAG: signal recognition particle receptor subunit alpha, partial [Gammaproteobacteria bacterium]|nr:signal recognition particle receptor subunit alpha [Gammaproteobacteria bacterium]